MGILSRFFALLLVVLTVSPVTAPFAPCDLAALVSAEAHIAADSKILNDTATIAAFVDPSARLENGIVVIAPASGGDAHSCLAAPPILRL